jgi:hypothetical protein
MQALARRGIPSHPGFTPIHLSPEHAGRLGYRRGQFPLAEAIGDTSLSLPFSAAMTEAEVEEVCDGLAAALEDTDRWVVRSCRSSRSQGSGSPQRRGARPAHGVVEAPGIRPVC